MGKKFRSKAQMTERKNTNLHLQKNSQQMYGLLAFFHLCLVSVFFFDEVCKNFFPQFLFFFGGFLNQLPKRTCFKIASATHTVDECIYRQQRDLHSNFSPPTQLQQLPATSKQNLCQDDCFAQLLTSKNGRYRTLLLHSKYTMTLQTSKTYTYTKGKNFCKTSFQLRMGLKRAEARLL